MVDLCLSIPDCNTGLLDHEGLTAFDILLRSGSRGEAISNMFYNSIIEMDTHNPQTALLRILTITSEPATAGKPIFPGQAMFPPVEDSNEPLVTALIARRIDSTTTNHDGDTALHMAAAKASNLRIVSKLINAGWDVNAVGNQGATPLHCAARTRDVEVVRLLLHHEANVGAKDDRGFTPLKLAEEIQCEDLVVLLQDATDLVARLVQVRRLAMDNISSHDLDSQAVDDEEQTPLHVDDEGRNPLHRTAWDRLTETVKYLVAGGVVPNRYSKNWKTPLHFAAEHGDTEIVTTLLAGGANPDSSAHRLSSTPLHLAAKNGHTETVSALLAGGASVDRLDDNMDTPLHLAAGGRHRDTVSVLLAAGASLDLVNIFS